MVELLLVVVVVGILAALVLARFADARERARVAVMESDLRNLASQQELRATAGSGYSAAPLVDITGLRLSDGVSFERGAADTESWSATVSSEGTASLCTAAASPARPLILACQPEALEIVASTGMPGLSEAVTFDAAGALVQAVALAGQAVQGLVARVPSAYAAGASASGVDWVFGDGAATSGSPATHATVSHSFTAAGVYTVWLILHLTDDTQRVGSVKVTVLENAAPLAVLGSLPDTVSLDELVSFDAVGSADPECGPLSFA